MFSSLRLKLFIIICYEKKYFFRKIKGLLSSLKKAFENTADRKIYFMDYVNHGKTNI